MALTLFNMWCAGTVQILLILRKEEQMADRIKEKLRASFLIAKDNVALLQTESQLKKAFFCRFYDLTFL